MDSLKHQPVLVQEVLEGLKISPGGLYLDATIGQAGHAAKILEKSQPNGYLLGIDRDPNSLDIAQKNLAAFTGNQSRFQLFKGCFEDLEKILPSKYQGQIQGILFDLGTATHQLLDPERGFSFQFNSPLDMRFDKEQKLTAAIILNTYSEPQLYLIFSKYGEQKKSALLARIILRERALKPFQNTNQLVEVVEKVLGKKTPKGKHPATKIFMSLRIVVNEELSGLEKALETAANWLCLGGRVAVIAFHSLEDRIVKNTFGKLTKDCICAPEIPLCRCGKGHQKLKLVYKKALTPSREEKNQNPRARSARLRLAEKVA